MKGPPGPRSSLPAVDAVLHAVERRISSYRARRALVAFSGGVDSSVVLAVAARSLGPDGVVAVTATSPSYPAGELEQARAVADSLGVSHRAVATAEVERPDYARNDALRCYHCKSELYDTLAAVAATSLGPAALMLAGTNVDDARDFRPGLRAAGHLGVRNPLLEEGIGKAGVRALARRLGLAVADKPALACLSSRVAFGIGITPELLRRIDRAEQLVRALGFSTVRVRHFGDRAAVEVDPEDVSRLRGHPALPRLIADLRDLGWEEVVVDPEGYRSGAMNATLVALQRSRPAARSSPA